MDSKKELEQLIDSLMKDDGLHAPSMDFTKNVVEKAITNQPILEKPERPLLPKWTWYLLFLVVLGFMLFGFQHYSPTGNAASYHHYLEQFGDWYSQIFARLRVSKIVFYVVVVGGALCCLQTVLLKNYWNSKLS